MAAMTANLDLMQNQFACGQAARFVRFRYSLRFGTTATQRASGS
jgi:hypothetical protein